MPSKGHSWFGFTTLYIAILLIPILLYVFVYQGSRIDEATVRNFRSLNAAANRINAVMDAMRNAATSYSFGVDKELLRDIIDASSVEKIHPNLNADIAASRSTARELFEIITDQQGRETFQITSSIRTSALGHCPDSLQQCHANLCSGYLRVNERHVVSSDCRPFRARNPRLYKALSSHSTASSDVTGKESGMALARLLNHFGTEISMKTPLALGPPTRHLSMFFDSYFVANEEKDVVFAHNAHIDHIDHGPHRAGAPFVSFATISDVLASEHEHGDSSSFAFRSSEPSPSAPSTTGHSTVATIDANDVKLSVFIHPFIIDKSLTKGNEKISTWYVVGVLPRAVFAREAIHIRLGLATDAMIAIALLLAMLPIFRFWSGGDRSVLSRFHVYGVGASAVGATALITALGWSVVNKAADGIFLDKRMELIASKVHSMFRNNLESTIHVLEEDVQHMLLLSKDGSYLRASLMCPSVKGSDENAMVLSSFLLNKDGKMTSCARYRKRHSRKLDLKFRTYFQDPHICEYACLGDDEECPWKRGPYVLRRIDSVVQGSKEVVVSFRVNKNPDSCEKKPDDFVAAAVIQLPAVDNTVLEPPYQYAVVSQAGDTLFHSDVDRERVSNFLHATGTDAKVRLALKSQQPVVLSTYHDGTPIRAHISMLPKTGDSHWALIVYRDYRLIDVISSLNVSLSSMAWLAIIVISFSIVALILVLARHISGRKPILPTVVKILVDKHTGCGALAMSALGLATCSSAQDVWIVGLTLPLLMAFLVSLAACLHGKEWEGGGGLAMKTFSVAAVILCVAVVPMLAWQAHFRSALNAGLDKHLKDELTHEIKKERKRFREYSNSLARPNSTSETRFLYDHFVHSDCRVEGESDRSKGAEGRDFRSETQSAPDQRLSRPPDHMSKKGGECAPFEEAIHAAEDVGDGDSTDWEFDWLRPFVAYSGHSEAIMRKIGRARMNDRQEEAFDSDAPWWFLGLVVLSGGILLMLFAYSVVRTKYGHGDRVYPMLPFCPKDLLCLSTAENATRVILVKRSERDLERLLVMLGERHRVRIGTWSDVARAWRWMQKGEGLGGGSKGDVVHVVTDLRDVESRGRAASLAHELARLKGTHVILCSDVVPSYLLVPGTLDVRDKEESSTWSGDWLEVLRGFDERTLCRGESGCKSPEACGCEASQAGDGTEPWEEALNSENRAHEDLKPLGNAIRELMGKRGDKESGLREVALGRFRAGAIFKFKLLWASCSYDEQLQILALARGGAPNFRQRAAISSLANRGIITKSDPLELTSEAFGDFVNHDVIHDSLDEWRRRGHRDWWRVTWLPLVILAGLGLMFFLSSNPEAIGTLGAIGAALIAFLPVVASLLRVGQTTLPIGGAGVTDQ